MRHRYQYLWKMACAAVVSMLLMASLTTYASQTGNKLKKAGKEIDELEQKKAAAEENVGNLKEQESGLKGELAGLNTQLSDVSAKINELEVKIADKQAELVQTKEDLQAAEQTKQQQYESMKLRIRFVYENGNANMIEVLLGSSSMSDFLSRAEYVEEVNKYDRKMLSEYENTCEQITEKEKAIETEQAELTAMQSEMEDKEQEVNSLIAKTQSSLTSKQQEISDAQSTVDAYGAQIEKMKAYEAELERKKAEEAKKLAAEQKKKEAAAKGGGGTVTANAGDLAMLAALVECEAGGESYDGQLAVASVVVNRVKSGAFPNTVSGVIYQGGQFSPVASGRFAMVLAKGAAGSCTQAANAALSGNTNVSSLYFCQASSGVSGTVIGNHVFY